MSSTAVLSVETMRAAEQAAMNGGISEWELMQRAGKGAARWVTRMAAGRPVTVLCGPGNNGGDGYVIADCLHAKGYKVRVFAPVEPKSETARKARAAFEGEILERAALTDPVVVDCLFGYGLSRDVKGEFATLLAEVVTSNCFKIAIDVPSSVQSDTGSVLGPLPRYDLTLALGAWKQAHFLMPAMTSMGALRCVPIGLALDEANDRMVLPPRLTAPAADSHKYRRGLLGVVAGAMPGAPLLSAEAAMHAGAGYVKLVSEHSHPDAPADLVIEQDLDTVLKDDRISAVLIGPGLGRDDEARDRLSSVLGSGQSCVLDADALHLLRPDMLNGIDVTKLCLTPHEGELAALCESFDVTAHSKIDRTRLLRDVTGMTVLAKGPDTLLAGRGGMRFFPRGSSWLSVAGSGDVLAGIVASRVAVHSDTMRACEEAVWLHNEAARRASPAFSASNLARAVKHAMAAYL